MSLPLLEAAEGKGAVPGTRKTMGVSIYASIFGKPPPQCGIGVFVTNQLHQPKSRGCHGQYTTFALAKK